MKYDGQGTTSVQEWALTPRIGWAIATLISDWCGGVLYASGHLHPEVLNETALQSFA